MALSSFRNKIFELPLDIRQEIDARISRKSSARLIHLYIKENVEDAAAIPAMPTLVKYIAHFKREIFGKQKDADKRRAISTYELGLRELDRIVAQVNTKQTPIFDRVRFLEGLAGKCVARIHDLEEVASLEREWYATACGRAGAKSKFTQYTNTNIDGALVKYIAEAKNLAELAAKISSSNVENEQLVVGAVRQETINLLGIIKDIIWEICPERYADFKDRLRRKMQGSAINVDMNETIPVNPVEKHDNAAPTAIQEDMILEDIRIVTPYDSKYDSEILPVIG